MRSMSRFLASNNLGLVIGGTLLSTVMACKTPESSTAKNTPTTASRAASGSPCWRYPDASTVLEPVALYSKGGVLKVDLAYQASTGPEGVRYCYTLADGSLSPTLHINPGDHLIINLSNQTQAAVSKDDMQMQIPASQVCGAAIMKSGAVNLHFHGTNVAPTCHQDEVIYTSINPGESFTYDITIPNDEPPGLYWYHPHIHGTAEAAVLGGASGALIVDGLQDVQPSVAHLPARTLIVRDQLLPDTSEPSDSLPAWDLSLNYVQVPYPHYPPALIPMQPNQLELWRVLNASANTMLNLKLLYDGVEQSLRIVGLDGVPTGSQDAQRQGIVITKTNILLAPASRAEFIVRAPDKSVVNPVLWTLRYDTGPNGDHDVERPLARITTSATGQEPVKMPAAKTRTAADRFKNIELPKRTTSRKLYFSQKEAETLEGDANFYITVDGQIPTLFRMGQEPSITLKTGSVEEWLVENRAPETHVFHIHQIHFLLVEQNGVRVSGDERQFLDTVTLPYWKGTGPYPSVKLLVDFRRVVPGDFVYHCHILNHEDQGMMAVIRVTP